MLRAPAQLFVILCALAAAPPAARAEAFFYNAAGELVLVEQADGSTQTFEYDAAGNILGATHQARDLGPDGGPGNGLPDWWELLMLGQKGANPLARGVDGLTALERWVFGARPGEKVAELLPALRLDGDDLVLRLRLARRARDVGLVVESSGDLGQWTALDALTMQALSEPPAAVSPDGELEYFDVRVPLESDRLFLRLRMSLEP